MPRDLRRRNAAIVVQRWFRNILLKKIKGEEDKYEKALMAKHAQILSDRQRMQKLSSTFMLIIMKMRRWRRRRLRAICANLGVSYERGMEVAKICQRQIRKFLARKSALKRAVVLGHRVAHVMAVGKLVFVMYKNVQNDERRLLFRTRMHLVCSLVWLKMLREVRCARSMRQYSNIPYKLNY